MNEGRSDNSAVGIIAVVVALVLALPCLLVVVGGLGFLLLRAQPVMMPAPAPPPMVVQPAPVVVPQSLPEATPPTAGEPPAE